MLEILFWILLSLVALLLIPDRWHARREIAKREAERRVRGLLL
jgi:hypothetical protein